MGWKWNFGFVGYGERWCRHRKLYHQQPNAQAARAYFGIQHFSSFILLSNLLDNPKEYFSHLRQYVYQLSCHESILVTSSIHIRMAGETILMSIYAYKPKQKNDYFIKLAEDVSIGLFQAATPGNFLVDFIPIREC